MLFQAQDANRARLVHAREKLAETMLRDPRERIAARKQYEEQAGQAGVVTINQADATFIDLNVYADDSIGAAFTGAFSQLNFGQAAVYKTRQNYPIAVYIGNLAAGPPSMQFATVQQGVQVQPFQYFSKRFLVPNLVSPAYDLEKFQEKEEALKRVAKDMLLARQQYIINTVLNQPLNQPIATSVVNYYSTVPFNNRTPWVLDPQVQTDSVPTTNIFNLTTEGGLTRNVFKTIRTYCNQAPALADDGEMGSYGLEPRALFVPVSGAPWEAYWNQASIVGYSAVGSSNLDTTKAVPQDKWEQAVGMSFSRNGAYMNWFGTNIFVQPTNILPKGYCLLATDRPAILGWDQMSNSVSKEGDSFDNPVGFNTRFEARSIALAQPDPFVDRAALIKVS